MTNDEIDLVDIYKSFKTTATYRILNNSFQLIICNKLLFTIFILAGAAGGYYLQQSQARSYKSEMLVKSNEINNYVSKNIVTGLNSLINQRNFNELNKKGVKKAVSSRIKNIEFIPAEIDNKELNIFKLILHSHNPDSLNLIENVLINYLNDNYYSSQLKKGNLNQFNSKKKELLSEINELDSLSILIKKQINSNQKPPYTYISDISKEKIRAKIKVIKLDKLILNSSNYHLLKGFTPTNSPEPIKGKYPLKLAFISFILGFIILRIFKK